VHRLLGIKDFQALEEAPIKDILIKVKKMMTMSVILIKDITIMFMLLLEKVSNTGRNRSTGVIMISETSTYALFPE
jgi:hypothetical protein